MVVGAERAAINTPLQGGASYIMTCAMLRLWRSPALKKMKWKIVAQIHDEVIMEGPVGYAAEAMGNIFALMEDPLGGGVFPYHVDKEKTLYGGAMRVDLPVDGKLVHTWHEAGR